MKIPPIRRCWTNIRSSSFRLRLASGDRPDEDDLKRMQAIGNLLQFNPDASSFLMAEFRFQKMLADIYKILGDAAGIDLDMLRS